MRTNSRTPRPSRSALALLAALLLAAGFPPACKLVQKTVEFPGEVFHSGDGDAPKRKSPAYVQALVMRFADTYLARIAHATNEFSQEVDTPEARIQALDWRIAPSTSAITIATGSNPNANLLDMITFVTLGRMTHEEYWQPEVWHEADQPMVIAYQDLDSEIYEIAGRVLTQKELEEVRATITDWRKNHSGKDLTGFVRLPNFKSLYTAEKKETGVFKDLANLLSIDPFSGLEPARREAAAMRGFAERALYWSQRTPQILEAQAELIALKATRLDDVQQVIGQTDRLSLAAESLAETAKGLPAELEKQREGLVQSLQEVEEPASRLLTEAQTTLAEGKEMSVEVREAIATLDAFVARVTPEENEPEAEVPGHPFDVREYGEAAAKVGDAAQKLDVLIARFDERLPEMKGVVEEVAQRSDRTITRALVGFLLVGLVLIGVAAAAALGVKRSGTRGGAPSRRARRNEPAGRAASDVAFLE